MEFGALLCCPFPTSLFSRKSPPPFPDSTSIDRRASPPRRPLRHPANGSIFSAHVSSSFILDLFCVFLFPTGSRSLKLPELLLRLNGRVMRPPAGLFFLRCLGSALRHRVTSLRLRVRSYLVEIFPARSIRKNLNNDHVQIIPFPPPLLLRHVVLAQTLFSSNGESFPASSPPSSSFHRLSGLSSLDSPSHLRLRCPVAYLSPRECTPLASQAARRPFPPLGPPSCVNAAVVHPICFVFHFINVLLNINIRVR